MSHAETAPSPDRGAPTSAGALEARSIELLRTLQSESGAFIASPSVEQYAYCWLRDGSFIAHALEERGFVDESRAFHHWVARVIRAQAGSVSDILARRACGEWPAASEMLHTRFTLGGDPERETSDEESWPNFQLDGYGTWLWALGRHADGEPIDEALRDAVRLTADYLSACWEMPCYDWWEEFGERQHTATLASIAAGLRAAATMLSDRRYAAAADRVMDRIDTACVRWGRFAKGPDDERVDASLLCLAVPFELTPVTDSRFAATVRAVEEELQTPRGGVWRYPGDTFFGGGAWILLTSWLGWYYALVGRDEAYETCEAWVRAAAGPELTLPEQLVDECQFQDWADAWTRDGALPGDPLLWSHAQYLLMRSARERSE